MLILSSGYTMEINKDARSVLTLKLFLEPWQEDRLNRMYETGRRFYNTMLGKTWSQYQQMIRTKAYRDIQQGIKDELQRINKEKLDFENEELQQENLARENGKKYKKKKYKEDKTNVKEYYRLKNDMLKEWGFTEYGILNTVSKYSGPMVDSLPSMVKAKSIGVPMWRAYQSVLFQNGSRVSFKKYGTFNNLTSDGKSGIRLKMVDGKYYLIVGSRMAKTKTMQIAIASFDTNKRDKFTVYEQEMLKRNVKMISIIRKKKGNKYVYRCHFVVEGNPYVKQENGADKYKIRTGVVGLAIWRDWLCAVNDQGYKVFNLCPNLEQYTQKKEALSREIESIRRCNNPENYNEDGTIKKGIVENGVKRKLHWHNSNRYNQLSMQLRELYRKNAESRSLLQNTIVHQLLEMGDNFILADTSFLTKKPEWDEENPLPNHEYKKKKERRVAIQEAAPSMLIDKLNKKLTANERPEIIKFNISEDMYWYHHASQSSNRLLFEGDKVRVSGQLCDHTVYRAWLAYHYDIETKRYENCDKDELLLWEKL